MNQRVHITETDSLSLVQGVARNDGQPITPASYGSISPAQRVNITLATLGAAMHEADLSLTRLSASEDEKAALSAAKARSLLVMCLGKFVDLMEVQS